MLARIARSFPSISRSFCSNATTGRPIVAAKQQDQQDVASVQRVEDELFGRYYGDTDSSDIKTGSRKYRKKSMVAKPVKEPVPMKPNVWEMTRLPLHDSTLGKLILDARNQKRAKKQLKMIVEGKRLIKDALGTGLNPHTIFVTEEDHLKGLERYRADLAKASVYKVAQKDLSTWSSLTTAPGILAIFERPQDVQPPKNCLPITVICDNIREPNNLGSIFRVCAALPCSQVIVMKGCADPWDEKCLRGGSGGQFHIPIEYPVRWEDLPVVNMSQVFLADNKAGHHSLKMRTIDEELIGSGGQAKNLFIVIGGETHGISEDAYEFAKSCGSGSVVNIPMAAAVESMNTASALAVILYELRRQLLNQC